MYKLNIELSASALKTTHEFKNTSISRSRLTLKVKAFKLSVRVQNSLNY